MCRRLSRNVTRHAAALLGGLSLLTAGCSSADSLMESLGATSMGSPTAIALEEQNRRSYQTDGDPKALRWLLANRIEPAMALADVNRVLGDAGSREFDDTWLKTDGGHYRADDLVYRWGPDKTGQSVYLVFRDGHLVNFNAEDYR